MSETLTQTSTAAPRYDETAAGSTVPARLPVTIRGWLLHELPYILMLAAGLSGVLGHLPVLYWLSLTPFFGLIFIVAGWSKFRTTGERMYLLYSQVLIWAALMFAIYILYASGTQSVLLTSNANTVAVMTLLALGTFTAGVQARLWQGIAVGVILFLAVPGISWIHQSALLLVGISVVVVVLGGLTWALSERRQSAV
jgi:uncharacterized membrane protein YphA (DoxX/SURF4 family)